MSTSRMEHSRVEPDAVEVRARARALNDECVAKLATSMAKIGLLHPISIYAPDSKTCILVAGRRKTRLGLVSKFNGVP